MDVDRVPEDYRLEGDSHLEFFSSVSNAKMELVVLLWSH